MTRPHLLLHIRPGRIYTLRGNVLLTVQCLVQNGQAQIAHADLIYIRQSQCKRTIYLRPVLPDRIPFPARITGRLQDRLKHLMFKSYHFVLFLHTSSQFICSIHIRKAPVRSLSLKKQFLFSALNVQQYCNRHDIRGQ